jgi:hypothetical protein
MTINITTTSTLVLMNSNNEVTMSIPHHVECFLREMAIALGLAPDELVQKAMESYSRKHRGDLCG